MIGIELSLWLQIYSDQFPDDIAMVWESTEMTWGSFTLLWS